MGAVNLSTRSGSWFHSPRWGVEGQVVDCEVELALGGNLPCKLVQELVGGRLGVQHVVPGAHQQGGEPSGTSASRVAIIIQISPPPSSSVG